MDKDQACREFGKNIRFRTGTEILNLNIEKLIFEFRRIEKYGSKT